MEQAPVRYYEAAEPPVRAAVGGSNFLRAVSNIRQHCTIPALRLKHRFGGYGTASALPKCSIMSGCGTRIVLREQKPLALCDRCPCFGSLYPPLAALTFAAQSIICAFGLAAAAPRSPYRHLELCGIAIKTQRSRRGYRGPLLVFRWPRRPLPPLQFLLSSSRCPAPGRYPGFGNGGRFGRSARSRTAGRRLGIG